MKDLTTIIKMNEKAVEMFEVAHAPKIPVTLEYDNKIIYSLYIGKNDKESGKQELTDQYFNDCIVEVLAENDIDGFTMLEAIGYWKGKQEKTLVIEIVLNDCKTSEKAINNTVNTLKTYFNQESIMVTKNHIKVAF